MRTTKVCPKCGHTRILLVAQVPDLADRNLIRPLSIATVISGKKTFMGDDQLTVAGAMSATVCRACGYAELYVTDPAALVVDGKLVREL